MLRTIIVSLILLSVIFILGCGPIDSIFCGNNICEFGEEESCPQDCISHPEIPEEPAEEEETPKETIWEEEEILEETTEEEIVPEEIPSDSELPTYPLEYASFDIIKDDGNSNQAIVLFTKVSTDIQDIAPIIRLRYIDFDELKRFFNERGIQQVIVSIDDISLGLDIKKELGIDVSVKGSLSNIR